VLPNGAWQPIKKAIVEAMFSKKSANIMAVLRSACAGADVICLQECALSFAEGDKLLETYHKITPSDADPSRAQNSIVLLKKTRFPEGAAVEVTTDAMKALGEKSGVDKGDLLVLKVRDDAGAEFVVASFHGDTNGLKTKPVVAAVAGLAEASTNLIFGLDANTYLVHEQDKWQGVDDFLAHCGTLGLRSCWTEGKPMSECLTTCHARTFAQPQLNKAIRKAELLSKGDVSPKDHILIRTAGSLEARSCNKDNTGMRSYKEQTPFPSLRFASDHAIVTAVLAPPKA